jgi:hypothetical protein
VDNHPATLGTSAHHVTPHARRHLPRAAIIGSLGSPRPLTPLRQIRRTHDTSDRPADMHVIMFSIMRGVGFG